MFSISDKDIAAIQAAFGRGGEMAATIELRRLFPGIPDNAEARRRGGSHSLSPVGSRSVLASDRRPLNQRAGPRSAPASLQASESVQTQYALPCNAASNPGRSGLRHADSGAPRDGLAQRSKRPREVGSDGVQSVD